jgi:chromosome segregation ATPase
MLLLFLIGCNDFQEKVNGELSKLQAELDIRNQRLLACEAQLARMPLIEAKNEALKKAIKTLETDQVDCKRKLDAARGSEGQVREDLGQALKKLDEKQNEIDILRCHISSKDDLLQKMDVEKLASETQMGELTKCKSENVGLNRKTAELEKELETLKQKMRVLAAENHHLKDDLNTLPGKV